MAGSAVGLAAVPQLKELLHRPELASGVTRVGEVLRRIDDVAKRPAQQSDGMLSSLLQDLVHCLLPACRVLVKETCAGQQCSVASCRGITSRLNTRASGQILLIGCGVHPTPRLVAVTKTHPVDKVKWGYQHGLRHFGENYGQELHAKSHHLKSCGDQYADIKWHYIGRIQRNKLKKLIDVPGLWMVETVSKQSAAKALDRCWGLSSPSPLRVLVQVNTSREESKLGCLPEETSDLLQYVLQNCPNLQLCGLMTVGRLDHFAQDGPNPDFTELAKCKDQVTSSLHLPRPLELSMGMSADFEHAIEMGSNSVRVGTALFGPRVEQ